MDQQPNISDLTSLQGRVAVITGGASGIGLGVAARLAEAGAEVALLDIDDRRGREAAESLRARGLHASYYHCDVTSSSDCGRVTQQIISDFGKIDVLFNNAGVAIRKNTVELVEEEWDLALDVSLKGIYLLSHHVIPHMVAGGGGSIINTGSGWSFTGGPSAVSYCAAKGGVLNLTRAMAIDHGQHNIRVNCVCPGDVDTPMLRSECEQMGEDPEEFMKEAANRPLNRVGTPADVANAVLFFASDMSTWVTGAFLTVDGGGTA
ncbi:MAG: SDR family oxidoreductase [Gemmatimonadetes bacterium]|nr:SDR family oxidoreductase [Gemmatimonadota bacterium]